MDRFKVRTRSRVKKIKPVRPDPTIVCPKCGSDNTMTRPMGVGADGTMDYSDTVWVCMECDAMWEVVRQVVGYRNLHSVTAERKRITQYIFDHLCWGDLADNHVFDTSRATRPVVDVTFDNQVLIGDISLKVGASGGGASLVVVFGIWGIEIERVYVSAYHSGRDYGYDFEVENWREILGLKRNEDILTLGE